MSIDRDEPAFPRPQSADVAGNLVWYQDGMSLRDYFAAKAMQGQIVAQNGLEGESTDMTAGMAYEMADAMLRTRVPDPSALHAARLEAAEAALEAGKRAGALWALDMKAEALRIVAALEKKKEEV